jgi:hypothetical protein
MLPASSKRLAEHMLEVNPSRISETEIIWDVIFYLLCSTPVGCRGDEVWDGLQLVEDANQINYEPLSKMSERNGIPSRGLLLPTWLTIVHSHLFARSFGYCSHFIRCVTVLFRSVNDVGSIMMCERRGIDHDVVFWVIFLMWRFIHE